MATYAASAGISGPSSSRIAFLRSVGTMTFAALLGTLAIAAVCTFTLAPLALRSLPSIGITLIVLGSFFVAHYFCRNLVYGDAKVPGFLLAIAMEGVTLSFLLAMTIFRFGTTDGFAVILQALGLTSLTAFGLLVYAWFNKSDFSWLRAGLSVLGIPLLVLMAVTAFFPIGGTLGLILSAVFVVISGAGLLYRLHFVLHGLDEDQKIEGAYEITMGVLVLFWNVLSLLNRVRR
jgi:FtsH-binding integral membrane protein